MTLAIISGIVVLICLFVFTRCNAPAMEFADRDYEYYDEDEWEEDEPTPAPRFLPGMMYPWEPIEDLLWACGWTRDEVNKAWDYNYINVCHNGIRAEFDGSLFATDAHGERLFACHQFDAQADTDRWDRWKQTPTDEDRRRAVWG